MNATSIDNSSSEKQRPMRSLNHFIGYELKGPDGVIGKVKDFLIDDETFGVRYLVADTGGWFTSNEVLVSPRHLVRAEEHEGDTAITVTLSKAEIEKSPPLDKHAPISRQYELEYAKYYGHQPYWGGGSFWGSAPAAYYPSDPTPADVYEHEKVLANIENCHLRSLVEISGYEISATDGDSGTVDDFIVELGTWKLRYLIVKAGGWFSNNQYLVDTEWITGIDWNENKMTISLAKDQIKDSPEFDHSVPVNRAYEVKLYDYYGVPHRWIELN